MLSLQGWRHGLSQGYLSGGNFSHVPIKLVSASYTTVPGFTGAPPRHVELSLVKLFKRIFGLDPLNPILPSRYDGERFFAGFVLACLCLFGSYKYMTRKNLQ